MPTPSRNSLRMALSLLRCTASWLVSLHPPTRRCYVVTKSGDGTEIQDFIVDGAHEESYGVYRQDTSGPMQHYGVICFVSAVARSVSRTAQKPVYCSLQTTCCCFLPLSTGTFEEIEVGFRIHIWSSEVDKRDGNGIPLRR